jgi:tol-pal system protein YbgF
MTKAFRFVSLSVCLVLGVFAPLVAYGQMERRGDSLQGLENRIQQLEYKLNQLRRDFDTGSGAATPARPITGFGSGATPLPDNFAARVEILMSELEQELTRLTGQLEEQGFTLSSVSTRLDKLVEDVDFRLSALERGPSAGNRSVDPRPQFSGNASSSRTESGIPPASPLPGAGLPRSLGTISSDNPNDPATRGAAPGSGGSMARTPAPAQQLAPVVPRKLPVGTPKEQYDYAFKLVRQGDYAGAELAFREFGQLHSSDPLAGNAGYWLGETYYVRQDFVQAADAFIGVVTSYPDSPKRPHSMLKLGMSLLALGQKQEGCATLGELLANDSQDAAATRARAESERQRAGCS